MSVAELALEWWSWVVPSTLQATLLLALAWALDRAFVRRAWPELLTTVWLVALARLVLPPWISSPWSVTEPLGAPTIAAAEVARDVRVLEAWAALWLAGFALVTLARFVRRVRLRSRIEYARSQAWQSAVERTARSLGMRRIPRLGTLRELSSPAVTGVFRPTLLLPASFLSRAPDARDVHAILHELTHVKRFDLWLDEGCELVRALFWFHPLVWIATERVRALGEIACDQAVARQLGRDARSYRDTLVLAARDLAFAGASTDMRAFLGRPSLLILRIERLERAAARSLVPARSISAAAAVVLAACVLPMAPRALDLRARARAVFERELAGSNQSCFSLHAAALVLAAPLTSNLDSHGD